MMKLTLQVPVPIFKVAMFSQAILIILTLDTQVMDVLSRHYFRYFQVNFDKPCKFWDHGDGKYLLFSAQVGGRLVSKGCVKKNSTFVFS